MARRKKRNTGTAGTTSTNHRSFAANVQSMDDIQTLFKETIAEFMEDSLNSEFDEKLGYEP